MTNGGYLTRDQVLKAVDLDREEVSVPEWGGVIIIRELTAGEREKLSELLETQGGRAREIMVALTAIDKDGAQLFTVEDIDELAKKNDAVLTRVADVAAKLSGLRKQAIEDDRKNSQAERSADSTSD